MIWKFLDLILSIIPGFGHAKYQDKLARERELDKEQRDRDQELIRRSGENQQLPSLKLDFDHNSEDCVYPHVYEEAPQNIPNTVAIRKEKRTDWYISLTVRNDGPTPARNCIGELLKLELAKNAKSEFEEIPIQGRQELKWSFDESPVHLAPNATKSLNIFIASSSDELLDVRVKKNNSPLAKAMKHKGTFRFTIAVHSNDVNSKPMLLAVRWDGSFNDRWSEENIWVVE